MVGVQVVGLEIPIWAILAEGGDGSHNETGVQLFEFVVIEAPFFHGARLSVLDENVRTLHQLPEDVPAGGRFQIQRDTLLVGVLIEEDTGCLRVHLIVQVGSLFPGAVSLGLLDLDHVRPHVCQHLRAVGTGDEAAILEDFHAIQRSMCHVFSLLVLYFR